VKQALVRTVRKRAGERCEYCLMPQFALPLPFQIDHILAEKHGGQTVENNLAFACPHCNRFKGPNIAGVDPQSGQTIRLFHPRTDSWTEHFAFEGAWIIGLTPIGRVTVSVLAMNADDLLLIRSELLQERALA
jgi:HNH endonuclease